MSKLYLIGGWIKSSRKSLSSCYTYDINNNTRNKIADLNAARYYAACTVFEGKVVVTGGIYNCFRLKSVEAFDHHENKWTFLPDMIEERCNHAAVSMGNKMFVIGESSYNDCEVIDSISRKFTAINSIINFASFESHQFKAFNIGNYIVVIQHSLTKTSLTKTIVYLYKVDKEKWINVECDFTKNVFWSSFVKYYT